MKYKLFIITKPLQLLVVIGLIDDFRITHSDFLYKIILIEDFKGANSVNLDCLVDIEYVFLDDKLSLFYYLFKERKRYSEIFFDSDIGLSNFFLLLYSRFFFTNLINIYEEGIGTYRTDIYPPLKKNILNCFGVGTEFGKCIITNNIYLFEPHNSSVKKSIKIGFKLYDSINKNITLYNDMFFYPPNLNYSSSGSNIALYLTDWSIDLKRIENLSKKHDNFFVKFHPHINISCSNFKFDVIEYIGPAEVLILNLLKHFENVTVYHHSSSCEYYLKKTNVVFINLE